MQLFQPCGNNLSGQHRRQAGAGATYFSLSLSNEPTLFGNVNKRGRRTCSEAPRQIWNKTYKQTTALRQSGANLNIPFPCFVFDSPSVPTAAKTRFEPVNHNHRFLCLTFTKLPLLATQDREPILGSLRISLQFFGAIETMDMIKIKVSLLRDLTKHKQKETKRTADATKLTLTIFLQNPPRSQSCCNHSTDSFIFFRDARRGGAGEGGGLRASVDFAALTLSHMFTVKANMSGLHFFFHPTHSLMPK